MRHASGSRRKSRTCQDPPFLNVNISGSSFENVNASGASIEDANLSGWRVHDANLSGLRVTKANLAGASISDSRLDGMTIDGIEVTELLAAYHRENGTSKEAESKSGA